MEWGGLVGEVGVSVRVGVCGGRVGGREHARMPADGAGVWGGERGQAALTAAVQANCLAHRWWGSRTGPRWRGTAA